MNKLNTLINLELKRNLKHYTLFLSVFFIANIMANILLINSHKERTDIIREFIELNGGITYGMSILNYNLLIPGIVFTGMFLIIIYSVYIWIRDLKDKSIYTYIMLPVKNTYFYLGKLISIIIMVYGYLLSQILGLYISKNIFNMTYKDIVIDTSLSTDLIYNPSVRIIIPVDITDFIMNNVLILTLIISIIFLVILFGAFMNGSKLYYIILGFIIITQFAFPYLITNIMVEAIVYIRVSGIGLIISIILINILSFKIINNKYHIEN